MKNKSFAILTLISSYVVLFLLFIFISKSILSLDISKKLYPLSNVILTDKSIIKDTNLIGDYGAYFIFSKHDSLDIKICDKTFQSELYNLNFVLSDNKFYKTNICSNVTLHNGILKNGLNSMTVKQENNCLNVKLEINSSKYKCYKWLGFISVNEKKEENE